MYVKLRIQEVSSKQVGAASIPIDGWLFDDLKECIQHDSSATIKQAMSVQLGPLYQVLAGLPGDFKSAVICANRSRGIEKSGLEECVCE